MSDPNGSLFNLEIAREISHRLTGVATAEAQIEGVAATGYTRLTAPTSSSKTDAPPAPEEPVAPPTPELPPKAPEVDTLEELLAWGKGVTNAAGVFAVDNQGFVIAVHGETPEDSFEGVGAGLSFAVEQLQQVDPTQGDIVWTEINYVGANMLVLPMVGARARGFLFGLVGPKSMDYDYKQALSGEVSRRFLELI